MDAMDWRFQLLGALVTAFVTVLTIVTPLVASAIVKWLRSKELITSNGQYESFLDDAIQQAILHAEEAARKALKLESTQWTGDRKVATAISFVFAELTRLGLRKAGSPISPAEMDHIQAKIEAELYRGRSYSELSALQDSPRSTSATTAATTAANVGDGSTP